MSAFDQDPGVRPSYRQFVAYAAEWEQIPDDGLPRHLEARSAAALTWFHESPTSSRRWSLAGLSALVVAMVAVRVVYTGNSHYTNLVWNLFLAWIPFAIAIYVYDGYRRGSGRVRLWAAGVLWLVFFPNAAYIVTDFKWLRVTDRRPDLVRHRAPLGCSLRAACCSASYRST